MILREKANEAQFRNTWSLFSKFGLCLVKHKKSAERFISLSSFIFVINGR